MLVEERSEPVGILVVDSRGHERFDLPELDIIRSTGSRTYAGTQHALEDVPLNRVRKNATDLRDRLSRTYGASDVLAHLLLSVIADGLVPQVSFILDDSRTNERIDEPICRCS